MTRYLQVTFSDGCAFEVPVRFIAEHRAKYYVELDIKRGDVRPEDRDTAMKAEIDWVMEDAFEALDWAANNMDWADVCDVAVEVEVERDPPDYAVEWTNAEKRFTIGP